MSKFVTISILTLAAALSAAAAETTTVFRAGDGGYASIRIPALLTAKDGTLLAFVYLVIIVIAMTFLMKLADRWMRPRT